MFFKGKNFNKKKNKNLKKKKKNEINKRLKKRNNINMKIIKEFKRLQLSVEIKKKKADFTIKNNFNNNSVEKSVKNILNNILLYV